MADLLRGQRGGQRQPWLGPRARALGQVKPGPAPRGPGAAVDRRVELGDHPQLAHPRLDERGRGDVPHAHGGVQHLRHLAAFLRGGEVGAHPALEVHGAAHVEHLVGRRAELVDAGAAGQGVSQAALGPVLGRDRVGGGGQVLQVRDAERRHDLQGGVQHVHGGARVIQGPVRGTGPGTDEGRQCPQLVVGHLAAGPGLAGQRQGVQHAGLGPLQVQGRCGATQVTDVEAGVVRDEDDVVGH